MNQTQHRELISGAETVYIYHNKIDATGNKPATEKQVFEACAAALEELKTLVRLVVNTMNGSNIIITSDHGFLYSHEPLNESDKASTGLVSGGIIEAGKRYIIADSDARSDILMSIEAVEREYAHSGWAYSFFGVPHVSRGTFV